MNTLAQLRSGALAGATHVRLSEGLERFPPELLDLAPTLQILDLSGNQLRSLPPQIARLENLKILFCSGNRFDHLPEALGDCPRLEMVGFKSNQIRSVAPHSLPRDLRWLILTDNHLELLPEELGHRPRLQKLMLAGNRLRALPASLEGHERLELLRIAANQLQGLPDWLFALPRLAWLATSGNPGSFRAPTPEAARLPWSDLLLGDPLGRGASGETYRARWGERSLAVKLFKGATTSDGTPQDEMDTCLAAGSHPHLPGVLGQVHDHPEGRQALAMDLLPEGSAALGNPPDFDTCTRDTFPSELRFDLPQVERIARAVASVCGHLADRGISHGDLYAHNILLCGSRTFLTDFGAANRWDPTSPSQRRRWNALEARAFGCLLDDLLSRCPDAPSSRHPLSTLREACLDPIPARRPRVESWLGD